MTLRIDRRVIEQGLSRWDAMAAELSDRVGDAISRIERLHQSAPWGGDAAGAEFLRAYMENDGPRLVLKWARDQVTRVADNATAVRQSVDGTAQAEAESFRGTVPWP